MINNDILERIRFMFDFDVSTMIEIFGLAELKVTQQQLSDWLKNKTEDSFQKLDDVQLAMFLNGLINYRRGKKDGAQPEPEKLLTNNMVFQKLKIALDLKNDEILKILVRSDLPLSKHELSAFFRKPGHKHYRECKDQVLRNFLSGLKFKYRAN